MSKTSKFLIRWLIFFVIVAIFLGIGFILIIGIQNHVQIQDIFGPPDPELTLWQKGYYELILYWHKNDLIAHQSTPEASIEFTIQPDESIREILNQLQQAQLISDPEGLRVYLLYTGLDKRLLAGKHRIDPKLSQIEIARALSIQSNLIVQYEILAGWRLEEIADSLVASGIVSKQEDFLHSAQKPLSFYFSNINTNQEAISEGFLLPDVYLISHQEISEELVQLFINNFQKQITPPIINEFRSQGLSLYEAVILASIVQRETIIKDEMPMIASVYLNRLNADMKLDSDPTVQYALGFNKTQKTWWTNPLSEKDLQIDSPYNTYLYKGLPPSPICSPSLEALLAIAYPAQSDYFYFRAACDHSGRHIFSHTYQEHLGQSCP